MVKQTFVGLAASDGLGSEPSVRPSYANDSFRQPNVAALGQADENAESSRFLQCLVPGLGRSSTRCVAASRLRAQSDGCCEEYKCLKWPGSCRSKTIPKPSPSAACRDVMTILGYDTQRLVPFSEQNQSVLIFVLSKIIRQSLPCGHIPPN